MAKSYIFHLNADQIQILLDTAESFIDNQKKLHIADREGEVVALPLTIEALRQMKKMVEKNESNDAAEIRISLDRKGTSLTKITICALDEEFVYEVNEEEFDSL